MFERPEIVICITYKHYFSSCKHWTMNIEYVNMIPTYINGLLEIYYMKKYRCRVKNAKIKICYFCHTEILNDISKFTKTCKEKNTTEIIFYVSLIMFNIWYRMIISSIISIARYFISLHYYNIFFFTLLKIPSKDFPVYYLHNSDLYIILMR